MSEDHIKIYNDQGVHTEKIIKNITYIKINGIIVYTSKEFIDFLSRKDCGEKTTDVKSLVSNSPRSLGAVGATKSSISLQLGSPTPTVLNSFKAGFCGTTGTKVHLFRLDKRVSLCNSQPVNCISRPVEMDLFESGGLPVCSQCRIRFKKLLEKKNG